jgi:hypothetical protein
MLYQVEELRMELNRRDQEMLAMGAKMKTLEEQHHDYQRHIAVLKESLSAKEEHQNMLQADVSSPFIEDNNFAFYFRFVHHFHPLFSLCLSFPFTFLIS